MVYLDVFIVYMNVFECFYSAFNILIIYLNVFKCIYSVFEYI
jgi:hypothetical protein